MAKQIDNAIGVNILPSTPSRENKGVNTSIIINTANNTGLATSLAASAIRKATPWSPSFTFSKCLKMFSTMTTEPSTIIPMAIASPPKLIKFAEIP